MKILCQFLTFYISNGRLDREGALVFKILAYKGGAYLRGGLNRVFIVCIKIFVQN